MPTHQELERQARDMESAWRVVENGERLTPAKRALLRPQVLNGIENLRIWAGKLRERAEADRNGG